MSDSTRKTEVNEDTLEKLLYLSRLSPESTDMATLKKQVDAYPTTKADALREDEIVAGLEMHDVKKINEGNFLDGYFQVPKVLGEGA